MDQNVHAIKEALEQRVTQVLQRHAMTNRGTFPPFRLPSVARTIIDGLLSAEDDDTAARILGGIKALTLLAERQDDGSPNIASDRAVNECRE